jgi:hypothetical protein
MMAGTDRRSTKKNQPVKALPVHLLTLPLALSGASAQAPAVEVQNLPGVEAARALLATSEWAAFRAFWDTVRPPAEGAQPDWEQVSAMTDTLGSRIWALERISSDSTVSACLDLLGQLCSDRLSMSAYGLPEMMTRMIPSRAVFHEEIALRRLEGRLASMREIAADPLYSVAEMAGLLGDAVREATSAMIFDALSDSWLLPHTFLAASEESLGTMEILALDLAALDSMATVSIETSNPSLKEACTLARGRIRSIQSSLPALELLLGDLLAPR